ncbi:MAG: hypothetical protein HND40_10295 [Ignavibacteriota bacterium]|jgi:hypothetical protein|nr:MAG: hypothetical protein HND40_10295 [Ignavibacteriota bacterium]
MDLTPDLLKVLANGGISIIIFVIWFVTYKTQSKQYTDLVERLFKQIEQDLKYKELLIGILTRLETKVDLHDRRTHNE